VMTRLSLANLLIITLTASLISLGAPWVSVVTLGRIRLAITFTITIISLAVVLVTAAYAIATHGRRGLWVTLAAIPALFWPAFAASIVTACSFTDCD
jgi:hypothetical protein